MCFTSGGSTSSPNGLSVVVNITRDDLNEIKRIEDLFIDQDTSYLSIEYTFIQDMNQNPITVLPSDGPLQISTYINDTTRPQVVAFDLDMNEGILAIYFLETVDILSVNYSCITLLDRFDGTVAYSLTGGSLLALRDPAFINGSGSGVHSGSGSLSGSGSGISGSGSGSSSASDGGGHMIYIPEYGSTMNVDEFIVLSDVNAMNDATAIFINFTLYDLNAIKALRIGEDILSSWLAVELCAVTDQSGLLLQPLEGGVNALDVRFHREDLTSPVLQEYDLDMNTGILTFRFSETVNGQLLDLSQITFHSTMDSSMCSRMYPCEQHSLNLDMYIPIDDISPEISATIGTLDLNEIKRLRKLAISESTTFISFTSDLIPDTNDNLVVSIPPSNAMQVTNYTKDITRPNLISFDLDLNADVLTLTFDETVDGATLDEMQITFQEFEVFLDGDQYYQLTGNPHDNFSSTILQINLSYTDRNALKQLNSLTTLMRNTWISITELLVNDTDSNRVQPLDALLVSTLTHDATSPTLLNYALNLTSEVLSLSFSETVDVSTLDVSDILLQNDTTFYIEHSYMLSSGLYSNIDSAVVHITLSFDDITELKKDRLLATTENNTFISFSSGFVTDTATNRIIAIPSNEAQRADLVITDTTPPELNAFDLDLTLGKLYLFFSETVDPFSLNIHQLRLQNNISVNVELPTATSGSGLSGSARTDGSGASASGSTGDSGSASGTGSGIGDLDEDTQRNDYGGAYYLLTGGSISMEFGPNVTVSLSEPDLNNIKRFYNLATEFETTYLSFPETLIVDTTYNPVVPFTHADAKQVREYTADTTPPVLENYSLSFDSDMIVFTFSEAVNVDSFNLSKVFIRGTSLYPHVRLTQPLRISDTNDTEIRAQLTRQDLNNLKREDTIATDGSTTLLYFREPLVYDMAGIPVETIPRSNAFPVGVFTSDPRAPILEAFDVNMNLGLLTLAFNETVNTSSLMTVYITLQTAGNTTELTELEFETHTLAVSNTIEQTDEPTLTIQFTVNDFNEIKRKAVCREYTSCFLSFLNDTVRDMDDKSIVAVYAQLVRNFTFDGTAPELLHFQEVDLNNGTLILEFSETVNVYSFNFTGITLQNFFRMPRHELTLTGGESFSDNGTTVTIQLDPIDYHQLLQDDNICSDINNCWITLDANSIEDMNGNGNAPVSRNNALDAVSFRDDETRPYLEDYSLDMNSAILELTFSEPVRGSTLDVSQISIQPSDNSTEYVALIDSTTESINSHIVVINLSLSDYNRIRITEFAKTENDTYLSFTAFAIFDIAVTEPNPVMAIPMSSARKVGNYTPDTTRPFLVGFELDLTTESIVLLFSEPVRPSTLDITEITLVSSRSILSVSILTSGYVAGEAAFDGVEVVEVILNRQANEFSKLDPYFGQYENSTLLALGAATITDMALNYNVPIAIENATEVSNIIPDTVPAELERFTIDFNEGRLHLIFTDIVIPSTLRSRAIQIQDAAKATTSVRLTALSTTYSSEGYVVSVDIGTGDLNAITYDTSLATSINNTYLIHSSDVVRDLQLRDVIPISDDFGVQATAYINDETPPQLESFSLDIDSGELTLSFSETVRTSSLNVSGIIIQNSRVDSLNETSFVQLTSSEDYPLGSLSTSDNGSSIVVLLGSLDLNEVKRLTNLGTEPSNTYVSIRNDIIVDMVGIYNAETKSLQALMATSVERDFTEPELLRFHFNLTEGQLYLTFSETVDASTLNVDGILVQNSSNAFLHRVMLQSSRGSMTSSSDDTVIIITIGRDDLNDIKRNRHLGTNVNNTYLFLEDFVIEDMNGNLNLPIYNPFGLQASDLHPDQAQPYLLNFTLDLNLGLLLLTFDETVETTSLMVDQILLQNIQNASNVLLYFDGDDISGSGSGLLFSGDSYNSSGSGMISGSGELIPVEISVQSRQLTAGASPLESLTYSDDNPVVVITLGEYDLNEIKRLTNLATDVSNTFISFTSVAVVDMNNNKVVEIDRDNAVMAAEVILDENPPYLRYFHLDMNMGQLLLTFNETVNASSLNPSRIVIQSYPSAPISLTHNINDGTVLSNDSTVVVFEVSDDDLNRIKEIPGLGTTEENTYLRFLSGGIEDMFGNAIREVETTDALMAINFTEDKISPELVGFDLDLDALELILTFDETINTTSLNVHGIMLLGFNSSLTGDYHVLSVPSATFDSFSTEVTVVLSRDDANEIKRLPELAVDASSTYISIQNFTVVDMNGNAVIGISQFNALPVNNYTVDQSRPILIDFHLNLDSNQLVLTFDETVDSQSIMFELITVHSEPELENSTFRVALTGDYVVNDDSHILHVQLNQSEVNEVKLYEDFGTTPDNTYVTTTDGAVNDVSTAANSLTGNTLNASHIVADLTSPAIVMFSVDLNAGTLVLVFNEPVNASTFYAPGLVLQNAARSRIGVRLTTSNTGSDNGQAVIVALSEDDLNEIKRIDVLFVDNTTSYITVTPDLIDDMMGNAVRSVVNGFALNTRGFIPDVGLPYISRYQLDMDEGYVTLLFSETVNVSSLDCRELTFSSTMDCSIWYSLTDCVINTTNVSYTSIDVGTSGSGSGDYGSAPNWITPYHYATSTAFSLTLRDLNWLKALEIAAVASSTYLSYTNQTIFDQSDLTLVGRQCEGNGLPIMPSDFVPDTTLPEIHTFNLSMSDEKLVISFSETVRSETLMVHLLSFQNANSSDFATQNYTLGADVFTRTYDGPTDILTINIGRDDLNAIKFLTELAISNTTTYLTAEPLAIRDMKSLPLVKINATNALQVDTFTADDVPPLLTDYTLDLNLGCLHLTFLETVNISTLNYTGLILQVVPDLSVFNVSGNSSSFNNSSNITDTGSAWGSGSQQPINISLYESCQILYFRLSGGFTLTPLNDPEVAFNFTWDDLNDIKRERCLATVVSNTYLSIDTGTILDMNDNAIESIDQYFARRATHVIPDDTAPNLVSFDLNLTTEILTLYFDETVNVESFDPTDITIYASPLQLFNESVNITETVNITDYNSTNSSVVYYYYFSSEVNYTLLGGYVIGGDDPVVELKLSTTDLNNLKAIVELATRESNTFVSITNETVLDMNWNQVNGIPPDQALGVDGFGADAIFPELISFDLNLNTSELLLTFDETVNVSSLLLSEITLLPSNSSSPTEQWTLNDGIPPVHSFSKSDNSPVVVVRLGSYDTNEIKRLSTLAISNTTTFLSITSLAISDMTGNAVQEIPFSTALQVSEYTEDEIRPMIVGFDLDLDTGNLTLEFDETVNASSLVISHLLLQNSSFFPLSSLSIYNSSVILEDDTALYVEFGIDFLNHLKRVDDLATSFNDTYLSFPAVLLLDMNGNEVVFINETSARAVRNYTEDTTSPVLLDFDLDMDEGELTLSFSETVRVATIRTNELIFSQFSYTCEEFMSGLPDNGSSAAGSASGVSDSASGVSGSASGMSGSGSGVSSTASGVYEMEVTIDWFSLTGGQVQMDDSHIVVITITLSDLNEIKKLRNLATSAENTYILFSSEALDDMYSNPVVALGEGEGEMVKNFTNDTTQPDVDWYHLDLDSDLLVISFTETVDLLTLVIQDRITFYNTSDFNGESYSLIDSTTVSPDGPLVNITLSSQDSNRMKFLRNLATSNETTYLFLNDTILDMVGNVITPLFNDTEQTRPANFFTADSTAPSLVEFNFDLDMGLLHLTFSEVVDKIHEPSFTLQNDLIATNATESHTLTGSRLIYGPSLLPAGPGHPPEVTLSLSATDLNEIKRLDYLAVSTETTYIVVAEMGVQDTFGNPLENDTLLVKEWIDDTTLAELAEFSFSADSGDLELTFDETVRVSTFNTTTVTFMNIGTGTEYTLRHHPPSGGTRTTQNDSTIIILTLANDDLNEIKILSDLATAHFTTYILLETHTVEDMRGNLVNVSNLPLNVTVYGDDMTRPELTAFDFDVDSGLLTLYFSESANASSLNIQEITLQPSRYVNTPTFSYTLDSIGPPPEGSFSNSTDGPIVMVYIGDDDLNEVKRIPELATLVNNTYISVTASTIKDMVDLELVPVENGNASRVQLEGYTPDTTDPQLISFNFDLDSGVLDLTFDETIDVDTLDQTKITLQSLMLDDMSLQHHQLMMGKILSTDDPVLSYNLSFNDLNNVKLLRSLAIGENSTYINLAMSTLMDMAYNANPSVPVIMRVTNFTDDNTNPNLLNFVVDINSSQLILNFDEPVDHRTLQIQKIAFQSSANRSNNPNLYFTLDTSTSSSDSGLSIIVDLSIEDTNEIKLRDRLLVDNDTTYISVTEDLVSDMRGNRLVAIPPISGQRVRLYIPDDTQPHLLEFHLDMDASRLHLTFLETMNASSINFTSFVLQMASEIMEEQLQYRLTGGDLESYDDDTVISIIITLTDLNAIKALQIASSTSTSWLVIDSYAIMDMYDLPVRPLMNGINAQQAAQYTIDTTRPELEDFTFDLNSGELTLYFSETVRINSLNSTTIMFQNAPSFSQATDMYTLHELGAVSGLQSDFDVPDSPVAIVELTEFDQNQLKRRPTLATMVGTTFVSVKSSTVYDMQVYSNYHQCGLCMKDCVHVNEIRKWGFACGSYS